MKILSCSAFLKTSCSVERFLAVLTMHLNVLQPSPDSLSPNISSFCCKLVINKLHAEPSRYSKFLDPRKFKALIVCVLGMSLWKPTQDKRICAAYEKLRNRIPKICVTLKALFVRYFLLMYILVFNLSQNQDSYYRDLQRMFSKLSPL